LPGLSCRHHNGLIHEANGHPVWALACRHFDGSRPCRCPRRKAAVMALQCAQCGSAVSARQACGICLGLWGLLVPMRVLLCVGNGRLPEGRRSGPLPEIDKQMRPLLPARMSDLGRSVTSDRVSVGVLGLQPSSAQASGHFRAAQSPRRCAKADGRLFGSG
jgi:hypothetical protein